MSKLNTPEDALPLLAYKIAPRQFDISYRFSNISLRDQIVRAQMLVRTLLETGLVRAKADGERGDFQLLICGAGAAGLAAAKEADAHNISFVLVEKGRSVPGGVLRSKATRYVSTAMYEWPHPNHNQHVYPLSDPKLLGVDGPPCPTLTLPFDEPVLIQDFGDEMKSVLRSDIRKWKKNSTEFRNGNFPVKHSLLVARAEISGQSKQDLKKMLDGKVSVHGVPLRDQSLPDIFLESLSGATIPNPIRFKYVIYAVGFAQEAKTYAGDKKPYKGFKYTPFWRPDRVFESKLGFTATPKVGILGSGDGALQDALRCLVKKDWQHPLDIWNGLMLCDQNGQSCLQDSPHVHEAMAKVAAVDGYTTNGAIWSHQTHVFESLDKAFEDIIDDLIKLEGLKLQHAVDSMARDDVKNVTIVTQFGYFSKAYALNRFLVILFLKLLRNSNKKGIVKLEVISGKVIEFEKVGGNLQGAHIRIEQAPGDVTTRACDLVLIRGGLDKSYPPLQHVGLSGMDTGRAGLGRIPPPIRPIAIFKGEEISSDPKSS
ncbi:NAD(P)-binding protein [Burkholderia sp. BCC0419]|uniref:NAD(P)-binding protein n=1 Tax=Burkholderia sp. BCC0419 TaxID=486878 RepID=UPI001589CF96|nr:NAD(P)-binding protein [Burkholderia sp. BCC0419]